MATSSELIKKLADVLAIPETTTAMFNRSLRDANLLTKLGARTPLDAARLLIAVLSTNSPSCAPQAVDDFGALELYEVFSKQNEGLTLPKLCGDEFEARHTFEDAFWGIIEGFSNEDFMAFLEKHRDGAYLPHIGVTVWDTRVTAQINIDWNQYIYRHRTFIDSIEFQKAYPNKINTEDKEYFELIKAMNDVMGRYREIRTQRELAVPEIMPIAKFVCGVNIEN